MRTAPSAFALVILSTLSLAVAACTATPPHDATHAKALPEYGGRSALLFDDRVDPLPPGPAPGELDSLLRERTLTGSSVLRARVVTVTSRRAGASASWLLELHAVENLAGDPLATSDLTLEVAGVPARDVVGSEVLAFVRVFSRSRTDGSGDVHFHVTRATESQVRTVRGTALLAELR